MIISKIIAGLGNQMFQYATGRALAIRNKSNFKLDITWYKNQNPAETHREYELNIFNIYERIASAKEILKLKGNNGSFAERVIRNRIPAINKLLPKNRNYYFENPAQKFESNVLRIKHDAYLDGWWQSYKYFDDIKDILHKEFSFRKRLDLRNKKYLNKILNTNSIGVHVRRGDYLKKYSNYFNSCSVAYYKKAVKLVASKTVNPVIYIFFSDDAEWIKKNFKFRHKTVLISHNRGKESYKDLLLMQSCKHNIIANSSFSWWAAYLNKNPNKIVVAPKKWLVDQKFSIDDRVPKDWIKI